LIGLYFQITLSYLIRPERTNIVNAPGFSDVVDPTRFVYRLTICCMWYVYPIHCIY